MPRREGARRCEETRALAAGAIQTSEHSHAQTGPIGIVTPDTRDGLTGLLGMREGALVVHGTGRDSTRGGLSLRDGGGPHTFNPGGKLLKDGQTDGRTDTLFLSGSGP